MTVTFDLPGVYIFRLTADDSALSNHDEVKIETNPVPFTCTAPNVADFFSGVVAGKNRGAPYSELLFLTLLSNGTLSFVSVYGQPGLVWQQESGSGAWTPFFTTDGYCIVRAATPGGGGPSLPALLKRAIRSNCVPPMIPMCRRLGFSGEPEASE